MRKSIKRAIAAAAIAGSALTGVGAGLAATAGPASAASVSTTAAVVTYQPPALNAWHQMTLVANGTTYTGYWLLLQSHRGGLLTGWLYDPNLPAGSRYLAVHGAVSGGVVVFQVTYGGVQGSRGFVGTISGGTISGNWTETGTEGLSGTFTA
jgi:hypothetical protein